MSENADNKPKETPAAQPPKGGGGGSLIIGMILPALLSAAGSYGGVRAAGHATPASQAESSHVEAKPPGPTMALEPFLVNILDSQKKPHPMKLSLAVEFDATTKEETIKSFMPRIRDAILTHMRTLTFEEAVDSEHSAKLRADLLERCRTSGAMGAERILITDLVAQ